MFNEQMPYHRVGRSGLKLSQYALGGWITFGAQLKDKNDVYQLHKTAYEAGINFFDIADVYAKGESEKVMGEALAQFPRHELVISSKVFWPMSNDVNDKGLSRKHIMESVERSLKRIGTDYLDLYFCHRYDPETPVEETIRAMEDLIRQGKILYWGTSEWSRENLLEADEICQLGGYYKPIVEQPQYSLLARDKFEKDTLPAIDKLGMGTVTWSPLASGVLTGKYDDGVKGGRLAMSNMSWLVDSVLTPKNSERVKKMKSLADGLGVSRSQLAIAWVAAQPGVTSVILGASGLGQLQENLGALNVKMDIGLNTRLRELFSY